MSLSRYMQLCLTHPRHGYYARGDPFGVAGDFITAPEISQLFGEMTGVWITLHWQSLGSPERWTLCELGPGRGTLMADAVRVLDRAGAKPELILVETSTTLAQMQAKRLAPYQPRHVKDFASAAIGDGPLIAVANEFFDALPIRQYQRHEHGWHERLIGLKDDMRCWGLSGSPVAGKHVPKELNQAGQHEIFEQCEAAERMTAELATALVRRGGAALVTDYGYGKTRTGVSLQAVSAHVSCDPLLRPGEVDLTTHVNFAALAAAAKRAGTHPQPLISQCAFLTRMGITVRAEALAAANPARGAEIKTALNRLMAADQMGELFKVLEITAAGP
ncbi:MAG: class I SAM-dependent methyltransferase [Alphaproteobacteria bacterium]|nr:class I SAM-dependent methyltransferase [Alphaproteobacteria bacterium]